MTPDPKDPRALIEEARLLIRGLGVNNYLMADLCDALERALEERDEARRQSAEYVASTDPLLNRLEERAEAAEDQLSQRDMELRIATLARQQAEAQVEAMKKERDEARSAAESRWQADREE